MNKFGFDDYNNITVDMLKSSDGKDYSDIMAHILKMALIRDAGFYEWMILNFVDIMDKENNALEQIVAKCSIIMQFFNSKDPSKTKEYNLLCFGEVFADEIDSILGNELSYGECMSLGMIANSYISYKRELLSKEEYYEIRDMFVPFGLTISLDPFDKTELVESIMKAAKTAMENNSFVLLKKTGKAAFYGDITKEEIDDAVGQLLVEWD